MAKTKTSLSQLRLITFLTADLFLLSCALTALILPYIPIQYDILGLAGHYPVYLQVGTVIAVLALYGALMQSAFITHFFASFLFFDLFVSALPRALLILSIFRSRANILSSQAFDPPTLITSSIADPSGIPLVDAIVTEGVIRLSSWWGEVTAGMGVTEYWALATLLKLGFVAVLALLSIAQGAAANCVRRYAMRLRRGEWDRIELSEERYSEVDSEAAMKRQSVETVIDLGAEYSDEVIERSV